MKYTNRSGTSMVPEWQGIKTFLFDVRQEERERERKRKAKLLFAAVSLFIWSVKESLNERKRYRIRRKMLPAYLTTSFSLSHSIPSSKKVQHGLGRISSPLLKGLYSSIDWGKKILQSNINQRVNTRTDLREREREGERDFNCESIASHFLADIKEKEEDLPLS